MSRPARPGASTSLRVLCVSAVLVVVVLSCVTAVYDSVSHTGCGPGEAFFRSRRITALDVTAAAFALMSLNWWLDGRGSRDSHRVPAAIRLVLNGSVALLCGLAVYDYLLMPRSVLEC